MRMAHAPIIHTKLYQILCKTKNAGVLYQTTMAVRSPNLNYQEGCVRAYIDGAEEPTLISSGLEDYFLGTYYFNKGKFYTPTAGVTHLNKKDKTFSAYRFHEQDPIFFSDGFRLTARCGEKVDGVLLKHETSQRHPDGYVYHNPQDSIYSTYVWTYEWTAEEK